MPDLGQGGARPIDWLALIYGLTVIAVALAGLGACVWLVVA
jgi:hypothetical protein